MRIVLPGLLLACTCLLSPSIAQARCALAGEPSASLAQWKAAGFAVADPAERNRRALGLTDCLGDPDPFLRDGIAFEALSAWMRGKQLDADTLRTDPLLKLVCGRLPDSGVPLASQPTLSRLENAVRATSCR